METTISFNNPQNQNVEMRKTLCGMCKKVRKIHPFLMLRRQEKFRSSLFKGLRGQGAEPLSRF
ncbi:MAG: hypothetical protein ACI4GB_03905, partial [Acutalibacteraceae bacterium]